MIRPLTVDHKKMWKILEEMGIPDHLTCLLRNLCADQEATVRTNYGMTDCFKIGKVIGQSCILSPCLFNLHAKSIMWNARLGEAQARIESARRNIDKPQVCRWHHPMAESEEQLKSLLTKVKEESEKADLKLNIQKTTITESGPIMSWQIDGGKVETVSISYSSPWKSMRTVTKPQY